MASAVHVIVSLLILTTNKTSSAGHQQNYERDCPQYCKGQRVSGQGRKNPQKPHSLINITDSPQKPAQRWSHRALDSKEYLPYGFGLFSEKNDVSTTHVHVLEFPSRTQVALPSRKRTLQNPLRKEAVVLSRERGQRRPTGLERSLRSTHKYSTAALSQQSDALSEIPVVQY